jgi:hypothetical protein
MSYEEEDTCRCLASTCRKSVCALYSNTTLDNDMHPPPPQMRLVDHQDARQAVPSLFVFNDYHLYSCLMIRAPQAVPSLFVFNDCTF